VKRVAVPNLIPNQAAFRLDTGELVLAEVVVESVGESGYLLHLRGWQVNEDGSRYTDERGGAVMVPKKVRAIDDPGADLDNEKADAMVAVANRLEQHIEALKAVRPNPDEDNDHSL
jgi:hypothetical protein